MKFELDNSLGYLFNCAALYMRKAVERILYENNADITIEEFAVIIRIHSGYPLSQSALISKLAKDRGLVTRMLNRLAAKGLIEKRADVSDKRNNIIYLTQKGQQTVDSFIDPVTAFNNELENKIKDTDIILLKENIKEIIRILQGDD